jgi:catechol 2,3-dioxygenase-like lactoylglutathione lyase family enzyme
MSSPCRGVPAQRRDDDLQLPRNQVLTHERGRMSRDLRRDNRPGLYCVELRTDNWPRLLDWYRNILGLRVLVRVVEDGYALLEAGDTRIALLARPSNDPPSGRISLAFEVDDIPKLSLRLEEAGSPLSHPSHDREGLREVNTSDPDGNRVRLFCWPSR